MPQFSRVSKKRLSECDPKLQILFDEVIKEYDCAILCGYRGEKEQNEAFANGFSKVKFPDSRHNKKPSTAVDVVPIVNSRIDWSNIQAFKDFANHVFAVAEKLDIEIEWGGNWHTIKDYPHFQLKETNK